MKDLTWWRGAVIYQIYPRSLQDSNGDGIGDLRGIINRLDYIASLNVDAIWISPFFTSPQKDFGYDIADYRNVDPMFGTLADFDELIAKAHSLNVKVMIDQVLSHTSNEHAWFKESREDKTNPKADWYVWADSNEDGTPPNNWQSIFGGCAWQWEPRRCQYYLHNFLTEQPDLNFHNPDVQQAALDNIEFWLKRGVDGFRLDAINFCFHDAELKDNPAKPLELRTGRGFAADNPYAFQYHYYNNTQPEMIPFIEKIRALLDKYPGTAALGEISSEDSLKTMAEYTEKDTGLHMGYSFELLTEDFSPQYIANTVATLEENMTEGWPCWSVSNHDVKRVATRWGGENPSPALIKMLARLVSSLRGSVCMYQGEELGLQEADVAFEDLQDPYGMTFWPTFKGRDGCRTPMPWEASQDNAGFSTGTPWLPVSKQHVPMSVSEQEQDDASILNHYRRFMAWRKQHNALVVGDINFHDINKDVLCFTRKSDEQQVLVAFNLSDKPVSIEASGKLLADSDAATASLAGSSLTLQAWGSAFIEQ
ncbi:alpha-glucosidase family protein [Paraferrimonas sp. SM1919]|uniref:alpha-glucosidase family protein n=1 Tax=Paraferrimonas sp. SM1919 TaxID=2662263 RepID=UPI0013D0CFB6|nr:alpha-glucosidase family protein [Paraferrimonas sp. SM1919]